MLLIVAMAMMSMNGMAKINQSMFGFTVGSSTESEVINDLKAKSMIVKRDDNQNLYRAYYKDSEKICVGENCWDEMTVQFHNNKLMNLSFSNKKYNTSASLYDNVVKQLRMKYKNYLTQEGS